MKFIEIGNSLVRTKSIKVISLVRIPISLTLFEHRRIRISFKDSESYWDYDTEGGARLVYNDIKSQLTAATINPLEAISL